MELWRKRKNLFKKKSKKNKTPASKKDIFEILEDYGAVLEQSSQNLVASPESKLPFSKEEIKNAIKKALLVVEDKQMVEALKIGYISLAHFIPDHEAEQANNAWKKLEGSTKLDTKKFREFLNSKETDDTKFIHKINEKIAHETSLLRTEIDGFLNKYKKLIGT